jgi:hypothetical protein
MHYLVKTLLAFIAITLVFTQASAFVGEFNNYIVVRNVPSEFSFTVTNNDPVARLLEMQILLPGRYEVISNPGTIDAGATEDVVIRLLPEKKFEGSEFEGNIFLKLGSNTAEKNLKIFYTKSKTCAVSIAPLGSFDANTNKFTVSTGLENNGIENERVELKVIRGIPDDWKVEGQRSTEIDAGEKKSFDTTLIPGSNFTGQAQLVYQCGDFVVERIVIVKFERPLNPLQGPFAAATGFFSLLGNIKFDMPGGLTGIVLDAILIIVAAVLLIAFIARVVHRIGRRPPTTVQQEISSFDTVQMDSSGKNTKTVEIETVRKTTMHNYTKKKRGKLETYNPKLEELKDLINGVQK